MLLCASPSNGRCCGINHIVCGPYFQLEIFSIHLSQITIFILTETLDLHINGNEHGPIRFPYLTFRGWRNRRYIERCSTETRPCHLVGMDTPLASTPPPRHLLLIHTPWIFITREEKVMVKPIATYGWVSVMHPSAVPYGTPPNHAWNTGGLSSNAPRPRIPSMRLTKAERAQMVLIIVW